MKLISVNVGLPRELSWHGRDVTTAIYKEPVQDRIALRKLNLDGDRQADLSVHGGVDKAVYCYPLQHYAYWKTELPGRDLPLGVFGETSQWMACRKSWSTLATDFPWAPRKWS